jgi:hypothetical protein
MWMKKKTIILILVVALLLVGNCGAIMASVGNITVNFTANKTTTAPGSPIQFTDATTPTATSWAWFFGDETYSGAWVQKKPDDALQWQHREYFSFVVAANGKPTIIGGSYGFPVCTADVWNTSDNGATWNKIKNDDATYWSQRYRHAVVVAKSGNLILSGGDVPMVTEYDDVWRSTDNGATWTEIKPNDGLQWSQRSQHQMVVMSDGSIVLLGGSNMNDVYRSTDEGINWTQMKPNDTNGWLQRYNPGVVVLRDDTIVLMGGYQSNISQNTDDVWKSNNYGATWTKIKNNDGVGWSKRNGHCAVVMPDDSIIIIGGTTGGTFLHDVWRSTDGGATWSQLPTNTWSSRYSFGSVLTTDGAVMVAGGHSGPGPLLNDVQYLQDAGSGGVSTQNPTHAYSAVGTYSVTLQASNGTAYGDLKKTNYITITNTPIATKSTGSLTISTYQGRQGIGIAVPGGVIPWGPQT